MEKFWPTLDQTTPNLHFVFLSHSEVDLLVCFGSLSCCITQVCMSLRSRTDGWTLSFRIFRLESRIHGSINYGKSSRSWSSKAAPHHHTNTTMVDCQYYVLFLKCCVSFAPKSSTFVSSFHRISYNSLGDYQDVWWQMLEWPFFYFWSVVVFAILAQSLSYCWIMNTDLNWGKWGLQCFRYCSGFFCYLLDELSVCSWNNFGGPATPEKVHHCFVFSPFVDNGSHWCSLESQSPRNGFLALSRLIDVNDFVSHLFLNFFGSGHDVLLFEIFQLHVVR